jgi:hypothetical protein
LDLRKWGESFKFMVRVCEGLKSGDIFFKQYYIADFFPWKYLTIIKPGERERETIIKNLMGKGFFQIN